MSWNSQNSNGNEVVESDDIQREIESLIRIHERLLTTKNDDIQRIIATLIPKLILLAENQNLLSYIKPIIQSSILKIDQLHCAFLPIDSLLELLLNPLSQWTLELAIECLDSWTKYFDISIDENQCEKSIVTIVKLIGIFPVFSLVSNHLLIYLRKLLKFVNLISDQDIMNNNIRWIIVDWILDLSIVQYPLRKNSVGSVQFGLSPQRIERLLCDNVTIDRDSMKYWKLSIIDVLSKAVSIDTNNILSIEWILFILLVLTTDSDSEICILAKQKLPNVRDFLVNYKYESLFVNAACDFFGNFVRTSCDSILNLERSKLTIDIPLVIFHYINKEFAACFPVAQNSIQQYAFKVLLNIDCSSVPDYRESKLYHLILLMLIKLIVAVGNDIGEIIDFYKCRECCKTVLKSFSVAMLSRLETASTSSLSNNPSQSSVVIEREVYQQTRRSCYVLIKNLQDLTKHKSLDIELTITLLQFLQVEDVDSTAMLHGCLHSMSSQLVHDQLSAMKLKSYLLLSREKNDFKTRKIVLEWLYNIYHWDVIIIETLLMYSRDKSIEIHELISRWLTNLSSHVSSLSAHPTEKNRIIISISNVLSDTIAGGRIVVELYETIRYLFYLLIKCFDDNYKLGEITSISSIDHQLFKCFKDHLENTLLHSDLGDITQMSIKYLKYCISPVDGSPSLELIIEIIQLFNSMMASYPIVASYVKMEYQQCIMSVLHLIPDINKAFTLYHKFIDVLSSSCSKLDSLDNESESGITNELYSLIESANHSSPSKFIAILSIWSFTLFTSSKLSHSKMNSLIQYFDLVKMVLNTNDENIYSYRLKAEVIATLRTLLTPYAFSNILNNTLLSELFEDITIKLQMNIATDLSTLSNTSNYRDLLNLKCISIEIMSIFSVVNANKWTDTWNTLFHPNYIICKDWTSCFATWEALLRMAILPRNLPVNEVDALLISPFSKFIRNIQHTSSFNATTQKLLSEVSSPLMQLLLSSLYCCCYGIINLDKKSSVIAILILLHQISEYCNDIKGSSYLENWMISQEFMLWIINLVLDLLRSVKDSLIRELLCMSLCKIFYICRKIDCEAAINRSSKALSLVDIVTSDIIAILTREKTKAAAGIALAGESRNAIATNTSSSNTGNTTQNVSNNFEAIVREAVRNSSNENTQDLSSAISQFSQEFGVGIESLDPMQQAQSETVIEDSTLLSYSLICAITRKSRCPALLYVMIDLSRKHYNITRTIDNNDIVTDIFMFYKSSSINLEIEKLSQQSRNHVIATLFHSKFSPNGDIRKVSLQIWSDFILAFDKDAVDNYEGSIFDHLIENLTSVKWRDREASCLAMTMLLTSRKWEAIESRLEKLWILALKAIDDIRETVRASGLGFIRSLTDQIISQLSLPPINSVELNPLVVKTSELFVPLLLKNGFYAPSMAEKSFAIGSVVRIVEALSSNETHQQILKPWLPDFVSILIESMSALEPNSLQYLQFHTQNLQISSDELENFRIQLSNNSPLQLALNACLKSLGNDIAPQILQLIASENLNRGVGLASRVSAAKSITYLCELYPVSLTNHCEKPFKIIVDTLLNSSNGSSVMRSAFSNALGSLAKILPQMTIIRELDDILSRFLKLDRSDSIRGVVYASCILEVLKRADESINSNDKLFWNKILSISYMGTFDQDNDTMNIWQKIFTESLQLSAIGSKSSFISKSYSYILETVVVFIQDLSWMRRVQSLKVLVDILNSLSASEFNSIAGQLGTVVDVILRMLPGHIWKGKHLLITVLGLIFSKCSFESTEYHHLDVTSDGNKVFWVESSDNNDNFSLKMDDMYPIDTIDEFEGSKNDETLLKFDLSIKQNPTSEQWKVSAQGWLNILIKETRLRKKDFSPIYKEYPIICSRAFTMFPWKYFLASSAQIVYFSNILETICSRANIKKINSIVNENTTLTKEDLNSLSGEPVCKKQALSETRTVLNVSRISKASKDSYNKSMFGSRYGSNLPSSKSNVVSFASSRISTNSREARKTSLIDKSPKADNQSLSMSDNPVEEFKSDPAYRLQFIELISLSISEIPDSIIEYQNINEWIFSFLNFIIESPISEVWSIRQSIFKLLKVLSSMRHSIIRNMINEIEVIDRIVLKIVNSLQEEKRHIQVRKSCFEALEVLVNNYSETLGRRDDIINSVKDGLSDSQPAIIQIASRIASKLFIEI